VETEWLALDTKTKCVRLCGIIVLGATVYFSSLRAMGIRAADFLERGTE
jgi:hypothetical protein